MTRFVVKGLVLSLVVGVAVGIGSTAADGHVEAGWVVLGVVLAFLLVLVIGQVRRLRTTYAITDRRLAIETGLVSRDLHQTRIERIQNVNCRQSLFERALGVGTVDFDTAGEAEFDFCFRGVDDPRRIVRTVDRALHRRRPDLDARTADV